MEIAMLVLSMLKKFMQAVPGRQLYRLCSVGESLYKKNATGYPHFLSAALYICMLDISVLIIIKGTW